MRSSEPGIVDRTCISYVAYLTPCRESDTVKTVEYKYRCQKQACSLLARIDKWMAHCKEKQLNTNSNLKGKMADRVRDTDTMLTLVTRSKLSVKFIPYFTM